MRLVLQLPLLLFRLLACTAWTASEKEAMAALGPRNKPGTIYPRGSRYLILNELGLKDHDYSGFWDLNP